MAAGFGFFLAVLAVMMLLARGNPALLRIHLETGLRFTEQRDAFDPPLTNMTIHAYPNRGEADQEGQNQCHGAQYSFIICHPIAI